MGRSKSIEQKVISFQQQLDLIPELAWNEFKTQEFIIEQLGKDFVWSEKTAVVYKLGYGKPIFFRADMDALNTPDGIKHVCGHSAHMASLMGAYLYLKQAPLNNTIYFIFQPSEEGFPSGAEFITKNFLHRIPFVGGFGFHVWENKEENKLYDVHMASGDYFEISIRGQSTHIKNKNSYESSDVLQIASQLIVIINKKKFSNSIINIGTITGGETANSIAGKVLLTGDIRANSKLQGDQAYKWLQDVIGKTQSRSKDVKISLTYYKTYPVLENDKKLMKKIGQILPISGKVISFGTEDFSLYPKPYVFLFIGTGKKESIHTTDFSVPNSVILQIYMYWLQLASFKAA